MWLAGGLLALAPRVGWGQLDTLRAKFRSASAAAARGDVETAERLLRQLIDDAGDDPDFADASESARLDLAALLQGAGRLEAAESLYVSLLPAAKPTNGLDSLRVATLWRHLADIREAQGRSAEGDANRERAAGLERAAEPPPGAVGAPRVPYKPGRIYDGNHLRLPQGDTFEAPKRISCPRFDPANRPARQRASDRYETTPRMEPNPLNVDAVLELVINPDGIPESNLTRVLRTSDSRTDEQLKQWVRACRFTPGSVNGHAVRVRWRFPVRLNFVP